MKAYSKIVFAHDHIFYKTPKNLIFSSGGLRKSAWDRYLKVFEEIHVISRMKNIDDNDDKIKKLTISSRENVFFYDINSISGPSNLLKNYKGAYEKAENIILKADAVIARLPSEIGNMAVRIAQKHKKPYAVEVVACAWDAIWNYGSLQGKLYAPYAFYRMKKNIEKAPYVIYVTNQFLQNRYPNKNFISNCSNVELEEMNEIVLKNRKKKILKNSKNIKIGLIAGLSSKAKGIDVAIKAMKEITCNSNNFTIHILGGGDKKYWENFISSLGLENKVFLEGTLPSGRAIYEWLDEIDIYIQPSFQEGLPRATIEAMSRGCLCIVSTAGGLPELVDNKFIHQKGDFKALSKLILDYANKTDVKLNQAKINYTKAKEYEKEKLENKRFEFWKSFEEYCKK